LSGLALRAFPRIEYPYFRLTSGHRIPSLASVLAQHGYRTIAVHPNARDFWNRATAFTQLGFAEFDAAEQFEKADRVGYYHSDAALTEHVLRHLESATAPVFLFAISIENHGPYENYPNADSARIASQPLPPNIDGVLGARLQGYFHHLENADKALARLVDALRQRKRRMLESLRLADSPGPAWTPLEDNGLRAIMRLQQRGELVIPPSR
jgi:phosphoglycerol transferase MdoB-like AlkP superfamily enzyme